MNNSVKLPEIRKEAFTKARESLGLSTKDLSGMACLSVRQIEQIENGESSSFYGAQVKFTAAKKVAALLSLTPEEAFDASQVPVKQSAPDPIEQEGKSSAKETEKKSKPAKSVEVKAPEKQIDSLAPMKSAGATSAAKNPNKKRLLIVSVLAALVFSVVNLRPLFFPEPVKEEEIEVVEEVAPNPPPAEAAADAKSVSPAAAPGAVAEVPAPKAVAPVAATGTECPAVDTAAINYKPDAPKKAGDMVYLQSKAAQTVCVVDASGKTQNKTLEPGVGVSVYGKPPLKVLTSGLNQVDIYYQGAKVRLGNTTAKTINLEPAEVIQPSASTDSQFR
ncbi:RodZ family helix-turn-helix domain-containing protein [Polynucleobacter sp. UK-Kesae-W10]|uniref:helix-turn-helix domain-containing protein n=1 Tax=Polynucleobacter sp. UK-Kesae-W10 TaxID=1819738 RepID=UPI001C0D3FF4|nr:helix-turn-helix transcriptional regulator [Polynucleobacter sp. UK-Kesae-W10]MBU3577757.1 helix-turn-helix transcriptional regulator [Polynucleobacter sp. UK-Kesae-W10]